MGGPAHRIGRSRRSESIPESRRDIALHGSQCFLNKHRENRIAGERHQGRGSLLFHVAKHSRRGGERRSAPFEALGNCRENQGQRGEPDRDPNECRAFTRSSFVPRSRSFRRPRGNAGAFWFTGRPSRPAQAGIAESPAGAGVSALSAPPPALSTLKPNLGVRGQPPRLLSPHRRQPSRTLALSGSHPPRG